MSCKDLMSKRRQSRGKCLRIWRKRIHQRRREAGSAASRVRLMIGTSILKRRVNLLRSNSLEVEKLISTIRKLVIWVWVLHKFKWPRNSFIMMTSHHNLKAIICLTNDQIVLQLHQGTNTIRVKAKCMEDHSCTLKIWMIRGICIMWVEVTNLIALSMTWIFWERNHRWGSRVEFLIDPNNSLLIQAHNQIREHNQVDSEIFLITPEVATRAQWTGQTPTSTLEEECKTTLQPKRPKWT